MRRISPDLVREKLLEGVSVMEAVAASLDPTRARIRHIEAKALRRLRERHT
jgi:DNA-directed RNA polymerase sigma subunit (sigma70/sigma32)